VAKATHPCEVSGDPLQRAGVVSDQPLLKAHGVGPVAAEPGTTSAAATGEIRAASDPGSGVASVGYDVEPE